MSRNRPYALVFLAPVFAALICALLMAQTARAASAPDFAGDAWNVLPPGQSGSIPASTHSTDQLPLYDGLTPLFDNITAADLPKYYKPNIFGLGGQAPESVTEPRPGLRIERDNYGVPHVYGDTRADVMFGAGYVAAQDRRLLMEILRGPGRLATLDAPGVNPFGVATSLRTFTPTQQTEDFLQQQVTLIENAGPRGQQILEDIRNYVDGINAVGGGPAWTERDVLAVASLIGAVFGKGGGDEARRATMLSALQQRLGESAGWRVWNDLRELQDPEAPVTIHEEFEYGDPSKRLKGNAIIDDGSLQPVAPGAFAAVRQQRLSSNALLIGAKRSAVGRPLFVAGPQVGYFYPQILMEEDLHGGGIDARGAVFPGSGPYVELGRGQDFSWSATSSGSDVIDHYVEKLCGSDTKYEFNGDCLDMTSFDAGQLGAGGGQPASEVTFHETVHGPVIGYATVNGERVAISSKRSTRNREGLNALAFADLNANVPDSGRSFLRVMSQIEFTFNWFYADNKDIAMFSSGRLPIRPRKLDPGLPALGTGRYEWRGFLPASKHPQVIDPDSGKIINWNNKPAEDFSSADDEWAYGSIHRSQLLTDAVALHGTHTLASLVAAMNRGATQDLRVMRVLPAIAGVLHTGPAPNARAAQMLALLETWRANGGSRLDRDLDTKIDDPGAAILDAAWPRIADAVMSPVLGPQLDQLARLISRDNAANSQGSSYGSGWYGYVDKDLRTLLGRRVHGKFKTRFCGQGDLGTCRESLWAALDAAGAQLEAAQGTDPAAWRQSAEPERIRFAPGVLPTTMRWTNRPTFQQVMTFSGHRPREHRDGRWKRDRDNRRGDD
jgi:acyl-homoserine lactone acylase PvdQ